MARFVEQPSPLPRPRPSFSRERGGAGGRGRVCAIALLVLLVVAGFPRGSSAADDGAVLKVPRFVSLHADKVNLRTGPGRQYPIEWILTRKNMPVEVVAQFEHWRRVREWDGTEGWVQEHMVDGKRFVVVARSGAEKGADQPLRASPDAGAAIVAQAEPGVIARLLSCRGEWCRVEAGSTSGWMKRSEIWGIYPDEAPQ